MPRMPPRAAPGTPIHQKERRVSDIDITNEQLVGMKGDSIVVVLPPKRVMPCESALVHAAWIVVLAASHLENGWERWEQILQAVKNT